MTRLITFSFLAFMIGCTGFGKTDNAIRGIDISFDDRQIIYCIDHGEGQDAGLYIHNTNSGFKQRLLTPQPGFKFYNPRFSSTGDRIAFIESSNDAGGSRVCVVNSNGSGFNRLTNDSNIITEVMFTSDQQFLLYAGASEYNNYSPITVKNAHNFDIYMINLETLERKKLTDLHAYGLYHISSFDSSHVLFKLEAGDEGGMRMLSIDDMSITSIEPKVDLVEGDGGLYGAPAYSMEYDLLAFTLPYRLYYMDMRTRSPIHVESCRSQESISFVRFFHDQKKLLFTRFNDSRIYTVDIETGQVQFVN
ncbi:MAG: hypothetical protein R2813_07170 [Flavobacteriales bacterium]